MVSARLSKLEAALEVADFCVQELNYGEYNFYRCHRFKLVNLKLSNLFKKTTTQ